MSTLFKSALLVLALVAVLWLLQTRVGPQQSSRVEVEVSPDALR